MPINDWQFWIVTATAAAALAWLIRAFYRIFTQSKTKPTRKRTALTIHGQNIQKPSHKQQTP